MEAVSNLDPRAQVFVPVRPLEVSFHNQNGLVPINNHNMNGNNVFIGQPFPFHENNHPVRAHFIPQGFNYAASLMSSADTEGQYSEDRKLAYKYQKTCNALDKVNKAIGAKAVFDHHIGTDPNNLQSWQDLCYYCGQDPVTMPTTIGQCQKWLKTIHVNIFDLADAMYLGRIATPIFQNPRDLGVYSRQTGKLCPAIAGDDNALLCFLLKRHLK